MENLRGYDNWKTREPEDDGSYECEECRRVVSEDELVTLTIVRQTLGRYYHVCEECHEKLKKQAYDEAYSRYEEFQAEAKKGEEDYEE